MTKICDNDQYINSSIEFIEFWSCIGSQLGSSRLKINSGAKSIHQVLDKSSDHQQYLRAVITQSYKRSRCNHLHAPVNVNHVLDVLGETAFKLQGEHSDDLLDIELLEEIAWHIGERYAQYIDIGTVVDIDPDQNSEEKARVVSLPSEKIRRANTRL